MSDTNWLLWATSIAEPQSFAYQIQGGVGATGMVAGSVASAVLSYIGPMIAHPWERELQYRIQRHSPGIIPPPASIVAGFYAGRIDANEAAVGLAYHGIDWMFGREPAGHNQRMWKSHIDLAKPQYPLEHYRHWYRQGRISRRALVGKMARVGLADVVQNDLFIDDRQSIAPNDIMRFLYRDLIDQPEAIRRFAELGIAESDAASIIQSGSATLDVPTLLSAYNRRLIDRQTVMIMLRRLGYAEPQIREALVEFANVLPTPAELVYLVVKDVWSQDVVNRFGYDLERPPEYDYWAARVGLGGSASTNEAERALGQGPTWAQMNWRAKWKVVSPEQAFVMMHRLRGDPNNQETWRVEGVRPFTIQDVDYVLKINDYAPGIREQLRAISYVPMRLVDIRNSIRFLGRNRLWAIEQFLDRGSSLETAENQADLAIAQYGNPVAAEAERRRKATLRKFIQNILNQYRDGILDRAGASNFLLLRGFTQADVDTELANIDVQLNALAVSDFIRGVRGDYLSGRRSLPDVQAQMVLAGISQQRISYYLQRWGFQRNQRVVQLSTEKVMNAYRRHFLSRDEALARLSNLGWNLPDILLQVSEAERLIAEDIAALATTQERQGEARAREIERVARQQDATRRRMISDLRAATPVTTVMKWFRDGVWNEDRTRERLRLMDYPADAIDSYIADNEPDETEAEANGQQQET